ncbi:MAG: response regulator transcription factor [Saprospiraceae bacterium]|jgi:DNA-binding NarL/FixJ family response regulator|nr:response regulator transcription factor [Saprospiraceae bacterium]
MIKVAIFDDHPAILEALIKHFANIDGITIVGQFTESHAVLEFLKTEKVDFLILDILTEEELGLSLFEHVAEHYKDIKVIAYTNVKSAFVHDELRNGGVIAVVKKVEKLDVLSDIICQHQEAISNESGFNSLSITPKEKDIAHYLARGLTAREISDLTQNSINTINNQKNTLLEKFECSNTTVLILKLTQMGLIDVI